MKKQLVFAGVMGVLLMNVANAEVTQTFPEPAALPAFSGETNQALITAAKPNSLLDETVDKIKVATTHWVDARLEAANADVQTLHATAIADKVIVDSNADAIDDMDGDRQVKPATDTCDTTAAAGELASGETYVACGYIAPNTNGEAISDDEEDYMDRANYSWVKIITVPSLETNS